ncbi:hypothetical protein ABIF76_002229 [Bradyrhizobium ottawaense]
MAVQQQEEGLRIRPLLENGTVLGIARRTGLTQDLSSRASGVTPANSGKCAISDVSTLAILPPWHQGV